MTEEKRAFVLRWQTPQMAAPAFWYFGHRVNADLMQFQMHADTLTSVSEVQVAANTWLVDADEDNRRTS